MKNLCSWSGTERSVYLLGQGGNIAAQGVCALHRTAIGYHPDSMLPPLTWSWFSPQYPLFPSPRCAMWQAHLTPKEWALIASSQLAHSFLIRVVGSQVGMWRKPVQSESYLRLLLWILKRDPLSLSLSLSFSFSLLPWAKGQQPFHDYSRRQPEGEVDAMEGRNERWKTNCPWYWAPLSNQPWNVS